MPCINSFLLFLRSICVKFDDSVMLKDILKIFVWFWFNNILKTLIICEKYVNQLMEWGVKRTTFKMSKIVKFWSKHWRRINWFIQLVLATRYRPYKKWRHIKYGIHILHESCIVVKFVFFVYFLSYLINCLNTILFWYIHTNNA